MQSTKRRTPSKKHPWKVNSIQTFKSRSEAYWGYIKEGIDERIKKTVHKSGRGCNLISV